jgi:polyhydroxyalkanoate synthesis regulator phasin
MPARKKTVRAKRRARSGKAASALATTWKDTREALGSAEAAMQRRVRALVKKGGARTQRAGEALKAWRSRLERERRKAMKQLEAQLATLQSRTRRERKALGRMAEDAVQNALAALNIPSRHEIHELTRRVEELSRKIDGFRRASGPRRASTVRVRPPAHA